MTDIGLPKPIPIQCTAGAIPYMNEKGEVSMKKVKVQRYVSGKRPEFAPDSSEESDEDLEVKIQKAHNYLMGKISTTLQEESENNNYKTAFRENEAMDHHSLDDEDDSDSAPLDNNAITRAEILEKLERHKQMHKLNTAEFESTAIHKEFRDYETSTNYLPLKPSPEARSSDDDDDDEEEEEQEDEDEEEIERRRMALRRKVLEKSAAQQEVEAKVGRTAVRKGAQAVSSSEEEEDDEEEEGSADEEEESTDEDDLDTPYPAQHHQRLKPVFVPKKDRVTIQEKEKEDQRQKELELLAKKLADDRKKDSFRLAEQEIKREFLAASDAKEAREPNLDDVLTDEEEEETGYERWKLRETERLKRDLEDIEKAQKDKFEIDRLHGMTEEDRMLEARNNPKLITNKPQKGKYKFLQKYYHRGAFYLDKEEDVLKRDVSAPTLEDHFDKTIMPKIMQVKNFGKSGRTKYTHLVDQDTTLFDSPWTAQNPMNIKFVNTHSGGMKQAFHRPSSKKNT